MSLKDFIHKRLHTYSLSVSEITKYIERNDSGILKMHTDSGSSYLSNDFYLVFRTLKKNKDVIYDSDIKVAFTISQGVIDKYGPKATNESYERSKYISQNFEVLTTKSGKLDLSKLNYLDLNKSTFEVTDLTEEELIGKIRFYNNDWAWRWFSIEGYKMIQRVGMSEGGTYQILKSNNWTKIFEFIKEFLNQSRVRYEFNGLPKYGFCEDHDYLFYNFSNGFVLRVHCDEYNVHYEVFKDDKPYEYIGGFGKDFESIANRKSRRPIEFRGWLEGDQLKWHLQCALNMILGTAITKYGELDRRITKDGEMEIFIP